MTRKKRPRFWAFRRMNGVSRSASHPATPGLSADAGVRPAIQPVQATTQEMPAFALDPAVLPPIAKSIAFDKDIAAPASGMHAGDWIEMILPALLISAALWFGNRIPRAEAPVTPPSFGSSRVPSSQAPALPPSGTSSASTGARPAPQLRSPDKSGRPEPAIHSKPVGGKHTKPSVLSVDVDEKGAVIGIEVLESAGATADAKAIAQVRTWTFVPTIFKGKPVRSRITVRYP